MQICATLRGSPLAHGGRPLESRTTWQAKKCDAVCDMATWCHSWISINGATSGVQHPSLGLHLAHTAPVAAKLGGKQGSLSFEKMCVASEALHATINGPRNSALGSIKC